MVRRMDIDLTQHDFQFTRGWFRTRNLPTFREFVFPRWSEKPVTYLEIGVFEGMSLVWMMQKVLTHPESRAIGVDPWLMTCKLESDKMEEVMVRAHHNLSPWSDRCELVRSNSFEVLRAAPRYRGGKYGLKNNGVDLCMIDGNHGALGVLSDALLCFSVVKPGGWMLFDDVENDIPKKDHVKEGVEMFREEKGDKIRCLWKHRYMECYEKV